VGRTMAGARRSPGIDKSRTADPDQPGAARSSSPLRAPTVKAPRPALSLDRLIHERLRLGMVSALAVNERLTFNELKRLLQTTDGNLSVHARKLEDAEYVVCEKSFAGRMPRTEYRLTAAGRRALDKYVSHMEAILNAVKA
jgi:DNA-binding HxlR family transcriptional regulator